MMMKLEWSTSQLSLTEEKIKFLCCFGEDDLQFVSEWKNCSIHKTYLGATRKLVATALSS